MEIDALKGWARFVFPQAVTIDCAGILEALGEANYGFRDMEITLPGTVDRGAGPAGFVVEGTGQRFPVAGDLPPEGSQGTVQWRDNRAVWVPH